MIEELFMYSDNQNTILALFNNLVFLVRVLCIFTYDIFCIICNLRITQYNAIHSATRTIFV